MEQNGVKKRELASATFVINNQSPVLIRWIYA